MVDVTVPTPKLELSEQPKTSVTSAVFNRPMPVGLGSGLEQLGQGAENLSADLARQQAQSDIQKQAVTLDANGVPQMANDQNSVILGQAGQDYQQAWMAGQRAALTSAVSGQVENIRQQHEGDPVAFKTAMDAYSGALRQTSYGPDVGNSLADQAQNEGAQHYANMSERMFEIGTRQALGNIQTNIDDTQNKMRVIARQGGIATPEYAQLQDRLTQNYDSLKSNKLFGYAPDRADSELRAALSTNQAEAVIGQVDQTFKKTTGDGGKAGAQKLLDDKILNNPDLNLSDPQRKQLYAYGMAHLAYLTSDQKAQIDANRVNVDKLISSFDAHRPVDQAVVNQAVTQAQSLGDTESVMKIQAYAGQAAKAAAYSGLNDEDRLQAMTGRGGDYMSKVVQQENPTGNPLAGNGGGPLQITPGTWQTIMRGHPELNLTPDGRSDPVQNMRAGVALTNDNKASLAAAGIPTTDANTYMAHFLGAKDATTFIKAMSANPAQPAAGMFLKDATANPTIFYRTGANGKPDFDQPRSLSEVYALQTRRFGGGTTPVVAAGVGSAPTQAQMQANPFVMSAYLDSLASDGKNEVATARNVGEALATAYSLGQTPSPVTVAAFNQVAEAHPDQLGEVSRKVQTQAAGAGMAASMDSAAAPQAAALQQQVEAVQHTPGAPLMTLAAADAAQKIHQKGVENLKRDPFGEAANRGWITRPPIPLDFSQPQTVPQALAERGQAAGALASYTGNPAQPMFAPGELPQLKNIMTSGTIDQRTALAAGIAGSGAAPNVVRATLGQLAGAKETLPLAVAGTLYRDSPDAARGVIQGQAILQQEPKYAPKQEAMTAEVASSIPHNDLPGEDVRAGIGQAARAYYAKLSADANDTSGVINSDRMDQAIAAVTGGVRSYRGSSFVAPWYGASQEDTDAAIRSLGDADFRGAQTSDGKPFSASSLQPSWSNALTWNNWRLQSAGDGKYLVFSGGDQARQYLGDGRGGKFVLDLGSKRPAVERGNLAVAMPSAAMLPTSTPDDDAVR